MSLAEALANAKPPEWKRRPDVLLSPNIPVPMSGVSPRTVLGTEWWDATRTAAYRSTDYHCVACGVWKLEAEEKQHLEGHELFQIDYVLGRMYYLETVPLCHYCHCFVHDGRTLALANKGIFPRAKYDAVMTHGRRVLAEAGLASIRPNLKPFGMAEWEEWRMVVGELEYPPKYASHEQWVKEVARDQEGS